MKKKMQKMTNRISPEQLINELTVENEKLKTDLLKAEQEINNFEVLAKEWKRGYNKLDLETSIKIRHLEQTIQELESEKRDILSELRDYQDR